MVSTTMTRVARITRNFGLISRPQAVRPPSSTPREKRNFPPFSLRLPFQLLAVYQVVASARLCCLSRVPPAVCPSLLESATTGVLPFCDLFPRTYIRRRLIPYYDSGPLHKHQIYIRPIFHIRFVGWPRSYTYSTSRNRIWIFSTYSS